MAEVHANFNDTFSPKTSDQDIIVKVSVGDGQQGTYAVFLGTEFIEANAPANLGKRADLLGKPIVVSVTIVDILKETKHTSMTVTILEGNQLTTQYGPYKQDAPDHLDTVIYTLKLS